MDYWIKAVSLFFISTVKFFAAPFVGQLWGFSLTESILFTTLGGFAGVLFFTYFSEYLMAFWQKLFPKPKKPVMSKKARRFVNLWKKYGLIGISFLTPVLISIPIGTFLAIRFSKDHRKVFPLMFGAVIFWGLLLNFIISLKNHL